MTLTRSQVEQPRQPLIRACRILVGISGAIFAVSLFIALNHPSVGLAALMVFQAACLCVQFYCYGKMMQRASGGSGR